MRHRQIKMLRRSLLFLIISICAFVIIYAKLQEKEVVKERPAGTQGVMVVKKFSFSGENDLLEWEEKVFKGKVLYKIEKGPDQPHVRAISNNAASALYYRIKVDAKTRRPYISWRWRVDKFPSKKNKEDLEKESEDDFAARVYVIFPAMFLTNSKVLEYIWAEGLSAGTTGTSHYSKNIRLIVLHSGIDKDKKWFLEERDILADYKNAFGRMPEYNIGAIAFMTNAEHTGSSAEAMYGDIMLGYKDESVKGGTGFENKILKNKVSDR